ncbi:MAG: type 4a pilus biogenesis protein PilO [Planctomycetota bacterium]
MKFGLRELIFVVVLLAAPVGALYFVFKPEMAKAQSVQARNEAKLELLQRLGDVRAQVDNLPDEIERGQQAIELIEAKLPAQQDVENILEQVWQIAERNNQKVRSVKSKEAVPAAAYMEQSLDIVMEGQFNGFYQFLYELEELPRITRIHDMDLVRAGFAEKGNGRRNQRRTQSSGTEELPPGSMRAEFTLSIFFEKSDNVQLATEPVS